MMPVDPNLGPYVSDAMRSADEVNPPYSTRQARAAYVKDLADFKALLAALDGDTRHPVIVENDRVNLTLKIKDTQEQIARLG